MVENRPSHPLPGKPSTSSEMLAESEGEHKLGNRGGRL